MNYRELPPLAFLPALEAAGRLGSFKAAARELNVTPSAIRQQVRAIEAALGRSLFERRARTVVLHAEGERYLREVRQVLRELVNAGRRLRDGSQHSFLRLNTVPFVAREFLLPRLAKLRARFPRLELQLDSSTRVLDLQSEEVDATIRFGAGPWAGVVTRPFGTIELALVCSPERAHKLKELRDVVKHPLLEIRNLQERGLVTALATNGLPVDPAQVQVFESYCDTVRAAEHGLGVAIGFFPMTSHWVTSGRLAVPLLLRLQMPSYVALVHRHGDDTRFPLAELADWLRAEYQALPPLAAGRIVPTVAVAKRARVAR